MIDIFFLCVYFQCFNPVQSRLPPNDGYLCAKCSAKCCKWFHVLCGQEPKPSKDGNDSYEFDDIAMVDDDDSDWVAEEEEEEGDSEEGEEDSEEEDSEEEDSKEEDSEEEDSEEEEDSDDEAEEIKDEEEDVGGQVVVLQQGDGR